MVPVPCMLNVVKDFPYFQLLICLPTTVCSIDTYFSLDCV